MAKPFKEGRGWAMRKRFKGHDIYVSGFHSRAEVEQAMAKKIAAITGTPNPKRRGAEEMTLGQALQLYALERFPFQKGAEQALRLVNRYCRAVGIEELHGERTERWQATAHTGDGAGRGPWFVVTRLPANRAPKVPKSLIAHRGALSRRSARGDLERERLAALSVARVTRRDVQALVDALRFDGRAAATAANERALLRSLFYYAHSNWGWEACRDNPAVDLQMEKVDNVRERAMSADEEAAILTAARGCRSPLTGLAIELLTTTAARCGELVCSARWCQVDLTAGVIRLATSKKGLRDEVVLLPEAVEVLRRLQALVPSGPQDPVLPISDEALKAAWRRVCALAGVTGLRRHDLRRTQATRLAEETGSLFVVNRVLRHLTLQQTMRYVDITASSVQTQVAQARALRSGAGVMAGVQDCEPMSASSLG